MKPFSKVSAIVVFGLSCFVINIAAQEDLSALDIMKKNDLQRRANDEQFKVSMRLIDKGGNERSRQISQMSKSGKDLKQMSLIRFSEPADIKGTGLLTIEHAKGDDDQWLYLPALGKTRRISSRNQSDYFMGSDFTFGDLKMERLENYNYSIAGSETFNKADSYIIEANPKTVEDKYNSGYSKRILWIMKSTFVNVQTRFYDQKGVLLKEFRATSLSNISGSDKVRASTMEMNNLLTSHKTILTFRDFVINKGIADALFTERYLTRGE